MPSLLLPNICPERKQREAGAIEDTGRRIVFEAVADGAERAEVIDWQ